MLSNREPSSWKAIYLSFGHLEIWKGSQAGLWNGWFNDEKDLNTRFPLLSQILFLLIYLFDIHLFIYSSLDLALPLSGQDEHVSASPNPARRDVTSLPVVGVHASSHVPRWQPCGHLVARQLRAPWGTAASVAGWCWLEAVDQGTPTQWDPWQQGLSALRLLQFPAEDPWKFLSGKSWAGVRRWGG